MQIQTEHTAPPHTLRKTAAARLAASDIQLVGAHDPVRLSAQTALLCATGATTPYIAGAGPPSERRRSDRHPSVRLQNRNALSIRKTYGTVRPTCAPNSMTTEG